MYDGIVDFLHLPSLYFSLAIITSPRTAALAEDMLLLVRVNPYLAFPCILSPVLSPGAFYN